MTMKTVTVPGFELHLTMKQLIATVQQLDSEARTQLALALIDFGLNENLSELIRSIYSSPPDDDITDEEINEIVREVRRERRGW